MGLPAWWRICLHQPNLICLVFLLGLCLAGFAVAMSILVRLSKPDRRHSQAGTATIEFALVFPIILFLILLLVQTALVMVGNIFTQYAAYAATRAAIVQIPTVDTLAGEKRNVILPSVRSPKFSAIRRAAVFALLPISGSNSSGADGAPSTGFLQGLSSFYRSYSRHPPNWVDALAGERLRYAYQHTGVQILRTDVMGGSVTFSPLSPSRQYTFGPRDPVTVRITYQFDLTVPYVRTIFADGQLAAGGAHGAYTRMTAQTTLTNEGVDPDLPPLPRLPRRP